MSSKTTALNLRKMKSKDPHCFAFLCFCPVVSAGMEKPGVVEQVDLPPTLALGLGLPISLNSVGRVIPGVLEETSLRDQLRFLHLNGHQLSCLLKDSVPDYEKGRFTNSLCPNFGLTEGWKVATSSESESAVGSVAAFVNVHSGVSNANRGKTVQFQKEFFTAILFLLY